jgi:hypothetical protein
MNRAQEPQSGQNLDEKKPDADRKVQVDDKSTEAKEVDDERFEGKPAGGQPTANNSQRGTKASVDRIRSYRDIWEREGAKLARLDVSLKIFSLLASASVTAFGSFVGPIALASLGLIAFSGMAIPAAFRLAKKSDIYWRAWRIVNWALISYDADKLDFTQLAEAHRTAEHMFEGWAVDNELPMLRTPRR